MRTMHLLAECQPMDIALVAPSPVPLAIGGAENLWWGLLEHLNRRTIHSADLIKLPTPERSFWEVVESYKRWAALDVSGYDLVISGKYPAWMVDHERHVCYMLHPLRGLYDTYPCEWPGRYVSDHPEVRGLLALIEGPNRGRPALQECFERLAAIRARADVPDQAFAFPGPLIRQLVQFFDDVGLRYGGAKRLVALSQTVAQRPGYFPASEVVPVAHAPSQLRCIYRPRGRYLFTVSRLDVPKRIDLLIRAMEHVDADIELRIAGIGPHEPALRELAGADHRISFAGFLNDAELAEAYSGARAVLFVPYQEDYGFITLEAMLSGKPVVTTTDAGGPTELIEDGVNGLVTAPDPAAIGEAMTILARKPRRARAMGRAGRARAAGITWERVVSTLLDGIAD
jgi:glycosyltransferase involved in cell wall biosynthesis